MRGWLKKSGTGLSLGLLLATVACSDLADTTFAPDTAPLASVSSQAPVQLEGLFNDPQGNGRTCDPTGAPDDGSGKLTQAAEWIDKQGGYLVIHGTADDGKRIAHALEVPKNAVRHRTLFCMRLFEHNHMRVRLKALTVQKVKGETTVVNVGKEGFREPVVLYMSYHQARVRTTSPETGEHQLLPVTPEQALRLYVAYEPDGSSTPTDRMQTFDLSQWDKYIAAPLPHFSKYVMMLD